MCKYILFTYPFGWDELGVVASVLGVIATVWAVSVALKANRNANEQLQSALRIQEQSKNVELLDKRMEILDAINREDAVPEQYLRLLFNAEITKTYQEMKEFFQIATQADNDISRYFVLNKERDGRGGFRNEVLAKIEKYEQQMGFLDCPQSVIEEFEKFCDDNAVTIYSDGVQVIDKTYNYRQLKELRDRNNEQAREKKRR